MQSFLRCCLHIAICASLASCTPIVDLRGHSEEQADYTQIIPGQTSEADVEAILGTPSTKSNFGENIWYYITEKRETQGMFAPQVVDQSVTAVHFDEAGIVEKVARTEKDKSKLVEYVEKETPTEGRKMSVMEQLMGNFGKFSAPGREIDPRAMR